MIHILNSLNIRPCFTWIHGGVTMLLVETDQGPVLVDAGVGIADQRAPTFRMAQYRRLYRASSGIEKTAFRLVQKLGYAPEDVRHIVMSHLHLDHAGGLADFPWARIHLLQREFDHIRNKPNWRYLPEHWAHSPKWKAYTPKGENWFGFDAVRLTNFSPEIWLIPLPGHTPGLAGVAIQKDADWLLYGSDALPYNARIDLVPRWFARIFMYQHAPKIRALVAAHPEIQLVSGHMPQKFYKAQTGRSTIIMV